MPQKYQIFQGIGFVLMCFIFWLIFTFQWIFIILGSGGVLILLVATYVGTKDTMNFDQLLKNFPTTGESSKFQAWHAVLKGEWVKWEKSLLPKFSGAVLFIFIFMLVGYAGLANDIRQAGIQYGMNSANSQNAIYANASATAVNKQLNNKQSVINAQATALTKANATLTTQQGQITDLQQQLTIARNDATNANNLISCPELKQPTQITVDKPVVLLVTPLAKKTSRACIVVVDTNNTPYYWTTNSTTAQAVILPGLGGFKIVREDGYQSYPTQQDAVNAACGLVPHNSVNLFNNQLPVCH